MTALERGNLVPATGSSPPRQAGSPMIRLRSSSGSRRNTECGTAVRPFVPQVHFPHRPQHLLVGLISDLPDVRSAQDQHVLVPMAFCFHRWAMSPNRSATQPSL